jgi:hypothetical protein
MRHLRDPLEQISANQELLLVAVFSPHAQQVDLTISHPPVSCDSLKHVKHQHLEASILSCWFLSVVSVQWCAFRVSCFRLDVGRGMLRLGRLSNCSFGEQLFIYICVSFLSKSPLLLKQNSPAGNNTKPFIKYHLSLACAAMHSADTLLVPSPQAPAANSKPVSVHTDSSEKAIPKHKHSGSDSDVNGGVATTLLEEDPFSSEASKILFDGVDKLRGCGAAVDLDLPQVSLPYYIFMRRFDLSSQ